jgi:hypothetical protein
MSGWITLHRKIREHWVWENPDYLRAWLDMLIMANYRDKKWVVSNKIVQVKRGDIATSLVELSKRWGWSRDKVRRFLTALEQDSMVHRKSTPLYTHLSICNYETYQDEKNSNKTANDTTNKTANKTQLNKVNKVNNKPPIVPQPNSDLSDTQKETTGGDFFAIQFFNLWVGEGKIVHPPTPYERKDIVQFGMKYKSDIEFWRPFLENRQSRISAGKFHHTSIKAFCGGAFRDYTGQGQSGQGRKSEFKKTKSGLWIAYCAKCRKKAFPNDYQLKAGSCCGTDWSPVQPEKKEPKITQDIYHQLTQGAV